jgi:sugar (pentulose or hexulose) kinase
MWNDKRARHEATRASEALGDNSIRPTFTLPKALWVRRHEADAWRRTKHLLSAGDWLLARFAHAEPVTDYTNALKTGVDLHTLDWPERLTDLGIDRALLPRVVAPGTPIGVVGAEAVADMGLDRRTAVVAGATDATAAQVAAGVVDEGEWVTTIGTGLSIKGVSAVQLEDDSGSLYSHRHWSNGWIPTGTSHCGADSLASRFPHDDLEVLAERGARPVSAVLVLPLTTVGEFFPFWAPQARGFEIGAPRDRADLLRGYLEGIGYVERLGMERMLDAGAPSAGPQVTMGGGAVNEEWMRIRAAILDRPTVRPSDTSSAFGAAVIAASSPAGISAAASRMVRYLDTFEPEAAAARRYEDRYGAFLDELRGRGYLPETPG